MLHEESRLNTQLPAVVKVLSFVADAMRLFLFCLTLLLATIACNRVARPSGTVFYLQSVLANDEAAALTQGAKPIGPKLSQKLRSVFKWKNYWEVKRARVAIQRGEKVREPMSSERGVELELLDSEKVGIRIFLNGRLTRMRIQPVTDAFCIVGGRDDKNQSWFIVVRRDEPQEP